MSVLIRVQFNTNAGNPPALPEVAMDNLFTRIEALCQEKSIRPGRLCDELGLSRSLMTDLKMGRKKNCECRNRPEDRGIFRGFCGVFVGSNRGTKFAQ